MNQEKSILSIRINQMRKENDLTQEELAKKLGLNNKSSIANYESGYSIPSDEIKIKMCEIFNCSMDYLMGESNFKTTEDVFNSYIENENRLTILKTIERYYEKVLLAKLQNDDINKIVDLMSLNSKTIEITSTEYYNNKIKPYLDSFDINRREIVKNLMIEILEELDKVQESRNIYYNLISSITENRTSKDFSNLFNIPVLEKITANQPILTEKYLEGYLPVDPNIYGMNTQDDYFYLKMSGESMNLKIPNGSYALIHKQNYAENGDIIVGFINDNNESTIKKYKKLNEQFILLEPMSTDPTIETITIDLKENQLKIIGKAIGQFGKF